MRSVRTRGRVYFAPLDLKEFQTALSRRLRALRAERGLLQVDFEAHGISLRAYQMLEAGERDVHVSTLLKLADAYGITIGELLTFPPAAEDPSAR